MNFVHKYKCTENALYIKCVTIQYACIAYVQGL